MAKKIIVLSGKQFSGKDTVAKILLEELKDFKRVGLGDAIKIQYGEQKGLTFEQIEKNKSQYRADLIVLGNWGRDKDPDYWLKKVLSLEGNLIVPDIRVKHELEIFKQNGAISIRVECPKELRAKRGELVKDSDKTETDLDDIKNWDFIIENNSDLNSLKEKAQSVVEKVKKM